MTVQTRSEVTVYHDETKRVKVKDGRLKGHVLFFVPSRLINTQDTPLLGTFTSENNPRSELYHGVMQYRHRRHILERKLHFSQLGGKQWGESDLGVREIVELGVDALRHKGPALRSRPLRCKVAAIFYPAGADLSMYGGDDKREKDLRRDETVLRMLLKGAAHYLYGTDSRLVVERIVSDGEPSSRHLDEDRVVGQIAFDGYVGRSALREYVDLPYGAEIVHLLSDHKLYPRDSHEFVDANMLQMADLLLGSIIRACLTGLVPWPRPPAFGVECSKKDVIAYPVYQMLSKVTRGRGFMNSGHYKSFSVSMVSFTSGSVQFSKVPLQKKKAPPGERELPLW